MPETLKQPCKLGRLKYLKDFVSASEEVGPVLMGSRWWPHPSMPSAAFSNTKNPCKENYWGPAPKSDKETKAVTEFIRSHLKSIKAYITIHSYPRCCCFPTDIHQTCHLTMRTWYVNKGLWFMHWHHYWLSVCSSLVIWVMLTKNPYFNTKEKSQWSWPWS